MGVAAANPGQLRNVIGPALQTTLLIFGIVVTLSTYLFAHHVRGSREGILRVVEELRERSWLAREFCQRHAAKKQLVELISDFSDVISRGQVDWFEPNNYLDWAPHALGHLRSVDDENAQYEILYRYIFPIEESLLELARLVIRHRTSRIYVAQIKRIVVLFVIIVSLNSLVQLLPGTFLVDRFVVATSLSAIILAVPALLFMFAMIARAIDEEHEQFREAHRAWRRKRVDRQA